MSVEATFYMRVYNVDEWMLRRAVESVLNQTEPNFRFIIQDNGSTDGSNAVLSEYAQKDKRIDLLRNEVNGKLTMEEAALRKETFYRNVHGCGAKYFAIIDSDDFYDEMFLEKALKLAKAEKADIVFAGYDQIDVEGKKQVSKVPVQMAGHIKELPSFWFEKNYATLRTLWGKLYSAEYWDAYWEMIEVARNFIQNGLDTYMIFCLLMASERVAFMSEVIYSQTVRSGSLYHSDVRVERILEAETLTLKAIELAQYAGILNEHTLVHLSSVYYYSVKDVIFILIKNGNNEQLKNALSLLEEGQIFRLFEEKSSDFKKLKADICERLKNE